MKNPNYYLFAMLLTLITFQVKAQNQFDLNGTFEGVHYEFNDSNPIDTSEYFYKFELTQDSNKVTGKSYIYDDDGYYAVVSLRGFIVENKLFFEEFNTIDETNPSDQLWCYNSGHLDIEQFNNVTKLSGFTKSYTKNYGNFCRFGSTDLIRTSATEFEDIVDNPEPVIPPDYQPDVSPNPTQGETQITFEIYKTQFVVIEVYDLSGELKLEVLRRTLEPGMHTYTFDLLFEKDGVYVVELGIDRGIYSTELWKGIN